ncbi:MAG TPA: molybdopterin cofactor-binding domain-containing protein, partial [Afifellaceae bacterium]|nr:molybdopterin cofactor-binding domain-containing protein [Afifellaceae bacterium]
RPLSAWVDIRPDDTIRIYSPGAEMGQGSLTGLAIIVAEELDADWDKVEIEFAPSEVETYGYQVRGDRSMAIVGSRAVMMYHDDLRRAGAQVRKVLVNAAAERWGVDPATLRTEPSAVIDPGSGRRMSYGEIAAFAEAPAELPEVADGELKRREDFRLIGKAVPRADIPAKVDGSAEFAIDVQLPGMVYATALHSPVQNGTPESWNDEEIRGLPGVIRTVGLENGVAIVADSFEKALKARDRLKVSWQGAKAAGFNSERALNEDYARIHADAAAERETLDEKGDADAAFQGAAKTYKSEFRSDLGYHAQMEPLNAVARFNEAGDRVEIWDGTQSPDRCREMVAEALGFDLEQVTVHQCYMGGAFGRRSLADYAVEAALIAREAGRPVKLIWTREEDLAHGMFRPQAFQCVEAATDAAGQVVGWRHCVVGDGGGLLSTGIKIPYYEVPNQHIERRGVSHGVRLKHWRAVGHPFNIFAIEGLIDEMATDAGMDPIQFRLERMSITPRARALFEKVAEMSDWSSPRPEGRALGASITERSGSLGAGVVEISLNEETGKIRVHKAWLAVDGGLVVLPEAAKANIESGIVYGLSSVLTERVTVTDGVVDQSNFHDYPVLRMSDTPEEMHIEFVDFGTKPTGLGEIGNPMPPAAVAAAFHALTGKRLKHMPFTPDRVLAALKA